MSQIALTSQLLKQITCVKRFDDDKHIKSMDFSLDGHSLVACNDDEKITLYDCYLGVARPEQNFSRKYGVGLVRFADNSHTVVHTSTKLDNDVRLLDLQPNNYVSYFKGHVGRVVSMSTAIKYNLMVTGSQDKTIRIWDVRSPNCHGLVHQSATPLVSFDSEGQVFAAITMSSSIAMYDMRSFDKAPFLVTKHIPEATCDWAGLQFSPDQRFLLVHTNGSLMRLFDAFNGALVHVFECYENETAASLEPCFTPDGVYIIVGSTDGSLHFWHTDSGWPISSALYDPNQPKLIKITKFNPKLMMLAAGGDAMTFWLPPNLY